MTSLSHFKVALLGTFLWATSVSSFSIQTRQSTLYSHDGAHILGTIVERKTGDTHEAWIGQDEEDTFKVTLPFVDTADSVGSSLWPSSLVGSILLHGAPQLTKGKEVLELGSGLGLGGLVAGRNADRCLLTDSDEDLVKLLEEHLKKEQDNTDHWSASRLDWRDSDPTITQEDTKKFDVCLGLDVAYYYYLIAPLVNTIRMKRKQDKSLMLVIGQANREAQWTLYHHIQDGGYNQITDEKEEPWEGTTKMLLYKLEMGVWKDEGEETSLIDGVLPIAAILHTTQDLQIDSITDHDHIATKEDEEAQMMTF